MGQIWRERVLDFLRDFVDRDASHRESIIAEVLESSKAAFARHTKNGSSRERLREAFNTPLYPMVLIANEVMKEGLDLHRSCRSVVHPDLVWNTTQLEQRVGRVNRLGSRLLRMREQDDQTMLEMVYPMIRGTIDERLFEVVRRREKWLEFLLGAPPNLREYRLGDEPPPPLPVGFAERLAADLGPAKGGPQDSTLDDPPSRTKINIKLAAKVARSRAAPVWRHDILALQLMPPKSMDVFSLRDAVVAEYRDFAKSFTLIHTLAISPVLITRLERPRQTTASISHSPAQATGWPSQAPKPRFASGSPPSVATYCWSPSRTSTSREPSVSTASR